MSAPLTDTRPEASSVLEALIRGAGTPRRTAMTRSLTNRVRLTSWRNLKRRHPHESERDLALRFAALVYGDDTAHRIRGYLARRDA